MSAKSKIGVKLLPRLVLLIHVVFLFADVEGTGSATPVSNTTGKLVKLDHSVVR